MLRTMIICSLIAWAIAFPLGRILEIFFNTTLTHALVFVGSLYLGFSFYAFLMTVLVDFIFLGDYIFHFFPKVFFENPYKVVHILWFTFVGIISVALCVGCILATHPRLRTLDFTIPKKNAKIDSLTIAMVSDIHYGSILGTNFLTKIAVCIKQAHPDIILIAGDFFDQSVTDTQRQDIIRMLKDLSCPLGIFAITGNHDYNSGLEKAVSILSDGGVSVLQDSALSINGNFLLVGRKDLTAQRLHYGRKSLKEILGNTCRNVPCILMDHQPFHLKEAEINNIDLQLSGHSHHGQLFPLNLFYRWVYERSWGYIRKGKTQVFVSCGAGTWGPPLRTNSYSEVLKISLSFR
jgi:predicted MPP superfamily phosphohydrolase